MVTGDTSGEESRDQRLPMRPAPSLPVYYVSPTQINVLVPSGVTPGPVEVTVQSGSSTSAPFAIAATATLPAVYAPASSDGSAFYVTASNHGACRSPTAQLQHFSRISLLAKGRGHPRPLTPHCSGINKRAADTRAIGPASCWSVFYGGRSSNLLRDAWVRVYTIFVMPLSQAACSPGTARVSILSRASRTWPPISGTKISTRRWCTSPLPRICCLYRPWLHHAALR